jgi:hypothetical protein
MATNFFSPPVRYSIRKWTDAPQKSPEKDHVLTWCGLMLQAVLNRIWRNMATNFFSPAVRYSIRKWTDAPQQSPEKDHVSFKTLQISIINMRATLFRILIILFFNEMFPNSGQLRNTQ